MDHIYWMPYYEAISKDLSLDPVEDATAARMLSDIISSNRRLESREEVHLEIERLIHNRDILVLGSGPDLEMELDRIVEERRTSGSWKLPATGGDVLIAADGATSAVMRRGLTPHVIVTDLDGGVEDQISCLNNGAVMLVHAHGDNMKTLMKYVPRLFGSVIGTTQIDPMDGGGLDNFGGFTDGDRAAFLAQHFGARSITLLGFNFNEVGPKIADGGMRMESLDPEENEFKFKKLAWANILLGLISNPEVQFYSQGSNPWV